MFIYGNAFAKKTNSLGKEAETSLEALENAGRYSSDDAGILILIAYGTGKKGNVSHSQLATNLLMSLINTVLKLAISFALPTETK